MDDQDDIHMLRQRQVLNGKQQLLLNYCYGHPNSDLLLLPYAPLVNFINHYCTATHDDTTTTTTNEPNLVMKWHHNDTDDDTHHHPLKKI